MASKEVLIHNALRLILPRQLSFESSSEKKGSDASRSIRSSLSVLDNVYSVNSPRLSPRYSRQSGSPIDHERYSGDDDDDDNDDDLIESVSMRDNHRFSSQFIRNRRRNSTYSLARQQRARPSRRSNIVGNPVSDTRATNAIISDSSYKNLRGQTLMHLAARLGHDEILRLLICETSQAGMLMNHQGQTPLLTAIKSGATSTATLLMESDPRSIIASDNQGSSVFHYACEYSNDVVLNRAITFLKRLNSTSDRITGLRHILERNDSGKTAFDIAIEKGQLKCVKQFLLSSWLDANIDTRQFLTSNSLRNAIDQDQFDILSFFVTDVKRFSHIIDLSIEIHGRDFNLLEYSIYLKKKDIIRLFVSVRIPWEEFQFHQEYKCFLKHYNVPFNPSSSFLFNQTPIQRMLTTPECVSLVPLLLEQFIDPNGIDFSVIDDSLYARPGKSRCIFGRAKQFSTTNWFQEHPLTLIAKADCKSIYDHPLVRMCVDLKFNLFGNLLFLFFFCCQSIYVALYTGITLTSPTPSNQGTNYYRMVNYSCIDLCLILANDPINPARNQFSLRALRFLLLIVSGMALLKEFYQIVTQRDEYIRRFYINLIEFHMYVSAIIYSVDINECTRQTGIRCSTQWMVGGIGLISLWTSLLLFVMNGIKFGKYGLLFITVYKTFLKFIAVYIFIWIGYILAFYIICKDILDQFHFFNFIPKLLAMFIGEYDLDSTFFPNNQMLPGAEAALILYSAYIFTMFIVMSNIMGGLAVADVKEFRLNAKREHLRSRIGVVLGFQGYFGAFCETISSITIRLSKNKNWLKYLKKFNLIPMKYQLDKLEIRSHPVVIPHCHRGINNEIFNNEIESEDNLSHSSLSRNDLFNEIHPQTGFYVHHRTISNKSFFDDDQQNYRLANQTDDIRDALDQSTLTINNQLRKATLDLQNELEDIKRRLIR